MKRWTGWWALGVVLLLGGCVWPAAQMPVGGGTASPEPAPTATLTPAPTWPPVSPEPPVVTVVEPSPSPFVTLMPTLPGVPTPRPGWQVYANAFLGYQLSYPTGASVIARDFSGMPTDDPLPDGFTFEEYFHYAGQVLPPELCVSVENEAGSLTIAPPYESIGRYVGPCPGMGIGSGYRMDPAAEPVWVAGAQYTLQGKKLFWESSGEFDSEYYLATLANGFRVVIIGMPPEGMSAETYALKRQELFEILSTLGWTAVPDLTRPGYSCAGKFTQLMPGVLAQVSAAEPRSLYAQPDAGGAAAGTLAPGEVAQVARGPVCGAEQVFWLVVAADGTAGWTAEGDGEIYYLERYRP